jgi:hypothetical protein
MSWLCAPDGSVWPYDDALGSHQSQEMKLPAMLEWETQTCND